MKKKRTTEDASIFFEILKETPEESKRYVSKSMAIAHQLNVILNEKGINQKSLADKLLKKEPEISKWLTGTHNFTIRTLTAIEAAVGEDLLVTPIQARSNLNYSGTVYGAPINKTTWETAKKSNRRVRLKTTKSSQDILDMTAT